MLLNANFWLKSGTANQGEREREESSRPPKATPKWGLSVQFKWLLHLGFQCCVDKAKTRMAANMATQKCLKKGGGKMRILLEQVIL